MELKNLPNSKGFKTTILVIGVLIFSLLIFKAGVFVGYYRASFSNQWGDRYEKTFGRGPGEDFRGMGMMRGFNPRDNFSSANGLSGKILDIKLPSLTIEDRDNVEKIVIIGNETLIRKSKNELKPEDLNTGDSVIIIGAPNVNAEIEARLIRVMPSYTTTTSTSTKIK
ncbi:MAG: hypothetical protein WCO84_03780 [bacterium]